MASCKEGIGSISVREEFAWVRRVGGEGLGSFSYPPSAEKGNEYEGGEQEDGEGWVRP